MAEDDELTELARQWIAFRRLRHRYFPEDIFDEFAWDMLLHLYVAAAEGRTVNEDELVYATSQRVASTRRWLTHLEKIGEIRHATDGQAEATVALTAAARERMHDLLADVHRRGAGQARPMRDPSSASG